MVIKFQNIYESNLQIQKKVIEFVKIAEQDSGESFGINSENTMEMKISENNSSCFSDLVERQLIFRQNSNGGTMKN